MSRVAVLIDGATLDAIRRTLSQDPLKVDLESLSQAMARPNERLRTYYYHCLPHQSDLPTEQESRRYAGMWQFLAAVERLPRFQLRLGKLERRGDGFEQKRVDILMAVDLVRMSWDHHVGTAVLVTGDSDLVPAVEAAKDAGVVVQLWYEPDSVHDELLGVCDEGFELTQELLEVHALR